MFQSNVFQFSGSGGPDTVGVVCHPCYIIGKHFDVEYDRRVIILLGAATGESSLSVV